MSQRSPESGVRELWMKVSDTLKTIAETVVQETGEITRMGKLKLELLSLENERGRKLEEIGRTAYSLYKGGIQLPTELYEQFAALDSIENRIAEKNREIERLKSERALEKEKDKAKELAAETSPMRYCYQCGQELREGFNYCPRCGTRIA